MASRNSKYIFFPLSTEKTELLQSEGSTENYCQQIPAGSSGVFSLQTSAQRMLFCLSKSQNQAPV